MSSTDLPAALIFFFSTGFAVGFGHCIGMCGPIVVAMGLRSGAQRPLLPHLLYNAGRIITYAILGGAVGATGSFTGLAAGVVGFQKWIMVVTGCLVVISGLAMGGWMPAGRLFSSRSTGNGWLARTYGRLGRISGRPAACFPLGLLLGLLPCGPVYTALLAAARLSMPEAHPGVGFLSGAAAMAAFGIGTAPAMILVARMSSFRWMTSRLAVYRAGAVLVMLFGALFIRQGLKL